MLGLNIGLTPLLTPVADRDAPPPPVTNLLTQIDATGWQGTWASPPASPVDPITAPQTLTVSRSGFDGNAAAVTRTDTVTLMQQIRQPYPNAATLTADQVSLSDFVYTGDQIAGTVNNSLRAAPRPVAMWMTPDYARVSSETAMVQLAVAHAHAQNGRPVAAVRFEISDGNTTATTLTNTMTPVTYSETGLTVPCFEAAIDVSGLTDGLVTVDATIYPWVGEAFTLSATGTTDSVNIGPLTLVNDQAGGVGTAYAYVDLIGNDATGNAATTQTSAQASPFATLEGAVQAVRDLNNSSFGRDNAGGAVVVVMDGLHTWQDIRGEAGTTTFPLVIRGQSRSGTIIADAGASTTTSIPNHMQFERITLRKTAGSVTMLDNAGSDDRRLLVLDDVTLDRNGQSSYAAWVYRVGRVIARNSAVDRLLDPFSTVAKHVQMIGSSATGNGGAIYNAVASRLQEFQALATNGSRIAASGQLCSHCFISQTSTAQKCVSSSRTLGPAGFAVVGTVMEAVNGDTSPCVSINADYNTRAAENVVFIGNTVVGSRVNWLYQDTGEETVQKSGYRRFNAQRFQNCKSDVFGEHAHLVGNWSEIYNVSNGYNAVLEGSNQDNTYGLGSWLGEVAGLGDLHGTDASALDPLWAANASFTGSGTGQGDYRPQAGSPLPQLPAGSAPYSHDQNGQSLTNSGSDFIGALAISV